MEFVERYNWRKVEPPTAWKPTDDGDELAGYYAGRTSRNGKFGTYEAVLIAVPGGRLMMVSGIKAIQLFDAAVGLVLGAPVRVVWRGREETSSKRQVKLFELFVSDGDVVPQDLLPHVPTEM